MFGKEIRLAQDYAALSKKKFLFFPLKLATSWNFRFVFFFRIMNFLNRHIFLKPLYIILSPFYSFVCCFRGIDLPARTNVGGGLLFPHYSGITINSRTNIGNDVVIFNGVTIGSVRSGKRKGVPIIGDSCVICPGAKIMGNLVIGKNCFIGANCVVVSDIPEGSTVVGNPARIVNKNGKENCSLYTKV